MNTLTMREWTMSPSKQSPRKDPQGRSVRIFVDADEMLTRHADAHRTSKTEVLSAVVRWFDRQPRSVQAMILGTLDEELRGHAEGQINFSPVK